MQCVKFVIIKIKNLFLPAVICFFTIFLIVFSKSNLAAAKLGLNLWATSVLPSLFPFFIATELLGYTNIISYLGKLFHKIMRPIFNVPGEGIFALLMGIISGYPVGAKIVADLKRRGICNSIECERLIAFTNNSGPLFILGTVGIMLFHSATIGIYLLISHILSSILVGICFRWWKIKEEKTLYNEFRSVEKNKKLSFSNLGDILSKGILNSINSILIVGGFVVLFSVVCSILENTKILILLSEIFTPFFKLLQIPSFFLNSIFTGIIELTNGLKILSSIEISNVSIYISSFLLGFGGISIMLQVLSIISKENISIKPYIIGKLLQAVFSVVIIHIII